MSKHIADIDLNRNQLKNVVIQTSEPSNPKQGQIYFNTSDNNLYRYNGSNWVTYQAPLSTVNASTISIDSTPTASSTNLVTSGGVYSAIQSSASDTFIISFTVDPFGDITCDKTDDEIAEAVNSNKTCLAKISTYQGQSGLGVFNRLYVEQDNNSYSIVSANAVASLNDGYVYSLTWPLHGSAWEIEKLGEDYLPDQTNNSSKFLTTNGTTASWGDLPTASSGTAGVIKVGTNLSISNGVLSATDTTYTFDGTYNASTNKAATVSTVTNAINALDGGTIGTGGTTKTITSLSQTNGNVSATFSDIDFPVTSVNTKTGAVSLTASDVGAATSSDISTAINALDGSMTGTAGAGKTLTAFSQTNGKVTATFGDISITKSQVSDFPTSMTPTSHASSNTTYGVGTDSNYGHLKLSDSTTSTSSTSGGIAATPAAVKAVKDAIPNVPSWAMASTKPTYTATEVGAIPTSAKGAASGVAPLNASSQIDPSYLPSYVDDVIEGYYNSTDGKFYEEDTYTTEITPEAGKIYIDLSTNKSYRWGGTTYVEMPTGSTVTVSPTLTSGEEVGTITIDGTTTTLYAPENTDTKVDQTKVTYSSYTYWRAIPFGVYNASTPTAALGATNTTYREYTVDNLRFWPQHGWLRTHAFNPAPNEAGTTASYNNMTSDSINNIYFRINATAYNNGDTVMTLYSNGTDMQVRPGGQYDDMVDLGKSTVRWKDLYLSGTIHGDNAFDEFSVSGFNIEQEISYSPLSETWLASETYATMLAAKTKGGFVYFNYDGHTAIATQSLMSVSGRDNFSAYITYIDNGVLCQKLFIIDSADEITVTETDYTFPTIYNGETS